MTPRDILRDAWGLTLTLVSLKSPIESYVVIGMTKILSFACGIGIGWWIWG
jgi:hypothetical protein